MIKHIVMWKLKENAEGKTKEENAEIIKNGLEGLKEKLDFLRAVEVGINFNASEMAYDVVLYTEFDSKEDLNRYQNHEEHLKVAGYVRKVNAARVVVDYEV
ncbi:Dabb family protein [Acetivibrio sp. MSJd-27]|jgi:stress responsive A/B barrel domain protein|uniref:Dabb family protein n=1 Tax=Acetivibrio sp. MSJd-27 TaxID=2841523 RepID=UPI0015A83CFB|nr:Dabb family protein [Acetivibrio sp. MSJd-27]MBU5449315.1 Dabb family protein [Acetivibrio sp. MSJd-27]